MPRARHFDPSRRREYRTSHCNGRFAQMTWVTTNQLLIAARYSAIAEKARSQLSKKVPKCSLYLIGRLGLVVEERNILAPEGHELVVSATATSNMGS